MAKKQKRLAGLEKYVINVVIALSLSTAVIFCVFFSLVQSERENINNTGQNRALRIAREVRYYLAESENAIKMEKQAMESLMKEQASHKKMEDYLVEQSKIITELIDENATGIYGVFDGEYIDGVGFVPDADYVPEERPWYLVAVEANGKVGLTPTYKDVQTGSMLVSVCQLLSDQKSVVALDLYLDGVQKMTEEIVRSSNNQVQNDKKRIFDYLTKRGQNNKDIALILDENGSVVAHSNASQVGHNYLEEEGTVGNAIATQLSNARGQTFDVKAEGKSYKIFSEHINAQWYAVMAMDLDEFTRPLNTIFILSAIVWILTLTFLTNMFLRINQRRMLALDLNQQLESVAGIFATAHLINLKRDTFKEIRSTLDLSKYIGNGEDHAREILNYLMEKMTAANSWESMSQFLKFETLDERMAKSNTITIEFLSSKNRWCRGRYVAVDRGSDGSLERVLWLVEIIDEEKRQRDRLLYLSETDRMTGINNRGSGEKKIKELLEAGINGMFCLMDADHFKSINDTFGHGVGDKVIIEIANCLKLCFREQDVVMRLGGDEFAVFVPSVDYEEAGQYVLDRFLRQISKVEIPEMKDRKIEISIGAAFYREGDTFGFEELYKRADRCTYESKKVKGSKATFSTE
ncbi:MAG: GGDEF domain-containing protein [Lachnospiraceae bacterium]|nr:GGDEF domain-containing protein [Lachnospiraceae bacterium]